MRAPAHIVAAIALLLAAVPGFAQQAGKAVTVTGVVSIERPDGVVRLAAPGAALAAGETVRTEAASQARLDLADGTQIAIRPSSAFKLERYRFAVDRPAEDNVALRLLKGGLRTLTGLIGKRKPTAFEFSTTTATIGVRGTDFVARLCGDDCAVENKRVAGAPVPPAPNYAGKVFSLNGTLRAARTGGVVALKAGDTVYSSDTLETGPAGFSVIVFRDGTRVLLKPDTTFAIENFRYEPAQPAQGSIAIRLVRGGLRALTGLIGQRNPARMQVGTSIATIGIRGTGFDLNCTGACAVGGDGTSPGQPGELDGLTIFTWNGRTFLVNEQGTIEIGTGEAGFVGAGLGPRKLDTVPPFFLNDPSPRPDRLDIDQTTLFGVQNQDFSETGVYVYVRDGAVVLTGPGGEYQLAAGEVGHLDGDGRVFTRLGAVPLFLDRDTWLRYLDYDNLSCGLR